MEKKRIAVYLPAIVRMRGSSLKLGAEMGAGEVLWTFTISKYSFNEVFSGEPKKCSGSHLPSRCISCTAVCLLVMFTWIAQYLSFSKLKCSSEMHSLSAGPLTALSCSLLGIPAWQLLCSCSEGCNAEGSLRFFSSSGS